MLFAALGVITWLALTPAPPDISNIIGWDKANHAFAFFVLAGLGQYSVQYADRVIWFLIALYGVAIEVCQSYLGYRYFELTDLLANVTGIGLFVLCSPLLLKLPALQALKTNKTLNTNKELTHG
ncbi:MAG: VanZ family protein [Candidatus Azotimanducaceae bacterium]|jgi:VanZ family protein